MRLNDIANQYAALNEIAVRTADSATNNTSSSDNLPEVSAPQTGTNAQYERQLERARTIANERAEQSNQDFEAAERGEAAIRDSSIRSRELESIINEVREGDLDKAEREALQERFDEVLSQFDQPTEPAPGSTRDSEQISIPQPPSSDQLGRGVSERFENLQAVSELDFDQASPEELEEAAAVIASSQNTLAERERQAGLEVNSLRNERNVFANVAQALDGNADFSVPEETQSSEREERLQRDTQAVQELIRQFDTQRSQNPILTPGSLFNLPA